MKPADFTPLPAPISAQYKRDIQAVLEVSLSPDEMKGYLLIHPSAYTDFKLTLEEVEKFIESRGICFGLDGKAVERMLGQKICDLKVQIAQGESSVPGEDARLEFAFDVMPENELVGGEDGRMTFKDWSIIQTVKAGQVLVKKIQVKPGKLATTVSGKKFLVPSRKDLRLPIGLNTAVDPTDAASLVSKIDGAVLYKNQRVHVQPLEILKGSIDYTIGNINYVGSLKVWGGIEKGFCVTLDGNLEVEEKSEDAILRVGGDVLIKGGILGLGKGTVDCRGNLTTKCIENQVVISGEDILVGGEVTNASLLAGGSLRVVGPRGVISGGDCAAVKTVEAEVLGDNKGTPTKIRVAYDHNLIEEYRQIEYELDKLSQDAQRVRGVLYTFEKMQIEGQLSDEDQAVLRKLKDAEASVHPQMERLRAKEEELKSQINKNLNGRVIAKQKMYEGVELHFGTLKYSVEAELGPAVFEVEDGIIKAKKLQIGI